MIYTCRVSKPERRFNGKWRVRNPSWQVPEQPARRRNQLSEDRKWYAHSQSWTDKMRPTHEWGCRCLKSWRRQHNGIRESQLSGRDQKLDHSDLKIYWRCIHPFHSSVWSRFRNPKSFSPFLSVRMPNANEPRERKVKDQRLNCFCSFSQRPVRSAT